ncbi:virion structural protein [Streptococcus phage 9871]|uniref:Antireceptor n=1 Tax=Streptococcus phage 9871 TaxID=1814957 RepID=A0A191KBB9_9CAUD|nr:virion structural protein [Streptococcus phage 9871]AMQ65713.1 antireceptor [Streptococcus phage 9871]
MTEHKIILSTTEPNSNIGIIKLRHADVNSQAIVAQIVENGQPKNFEGLQPYFCLMAQEVTGQGVSEESVVSFDAKNGTLKYVASDNALQMVGHNEAYFSFRKQEDGRWIEQFSTRTFHYIVEKSIYSQPFKDSNYWWTFKELNRIFNQYIEDGKTSWEEFVKSNREIIESIDPGGQVLSELIRSRKPEDAASAYPDLPTRLDKQIGKNTDFRSFESDKSFMTRVYNESAERGVNVKWFGAKGDGVTDDTVAIQSAIDTGFSVFIPPGKYNVKELKGFSSGQIIQGISKVESWGGKNTQNITLLNGIGSADNYVIKNNVWGDGILPNAITVKNLSIEGSKRTNGILVGNSSTIEGVKIANCINGLSNIKVSNVMNCQINGCTNGVMNATDSKITNNFFYFNEVGINFDNSNDNSIVNNKIEWNGIGISLTKATYNLISNNIIDRNTTYGIYTSNAVSTTISGNQFERNLTNHLYLHGSLFNISTNSFFRKNSEDNQSGIVAPDVAIFTKSIENSSITSNLVNGKMFNKTGTDYTSNLSIFANTIDGINPDNITVSIPETTAFHGKDTKIIIPLPNYFDGALNNPYNVEILSQKISFISQKGNFYSNGEIIKSIYMSASGIELTIFNGLSDDLKITGSINVRCSYPSIY